MQNDRSTIQFRVISVPQLEPSAFKHKKCGASSCVYDAEWGPHDGNYITWNAAICTYPRFVSYEPAEASWLALKEKGIYQHDSWDCLEPSSVKYGNRWMVKLRPPKPDGDSNGPSDEDGVCDELAETTFNMYARSLLEQWNVLEELQQDNLYGALEDDAWDEFWDDIQHVIQKPSINTYVGSSHREVG